MEKPYVAGIDIGGQTSKLGIVDARGTVLAQTSIRTDTHKDVNLFIEDLCHALEKLAEKTGGLSKVRGIGIGAPNGNYYTGTIENAVNLVWGGGVAIPFAKLMRDKLEIPVALTNDANAAAVGEMTYGAARGMKNFIMITLGTGVGSGIVINGDVVYGHDGFAGELGHTTAVRYNGRLCNCGRTGCLETYASAIGVARTAKEWLESSDEPSILRGISDNITSKDVYEAASQGDKMAIRIFEFTGKKLGESFAEFVAFSAPQAIILFGGLSRAGDMILKPIVEHMNANLLHLWKNKIDVFFSQLKESDAAILGASALGWEIK
ncbi:Glucokinase [bioreactor metagenome]|jgi:glucokinase|uniref:Glucokinase n=1 Tax=bioreactor metagenome TaxID=1076179 RepID=A0A644TZJ7_9ZZZZ|nr:ROK family protein [Bacteroidales bacterium]MBP9584276.1 ROK family protein [Bacteroidales bacterium]MBP9978970.1 ROK family protein [Bacteroidales bacterium]